MAKNNRKKQTVQKSSKPKMSPTNIRMMKRDGFRFPVLSVPNEGFIDKAGWFYRNFYVILAFIIPCALMYTAFALHKVQPFGDKQILVTDLWHQYFPFLVDFQDKLRNGDSLLWSWTQGGGTNYVSLIAYYLSSPLSFLTVLLPTKLFDYGNIAVLNMYLTFTVAVRIALASGFFAIFARYVFKRNDMSLLVFGASYAFSAFFMGYYWCYIWLETAALTPLVVMGFVALMREGRYRLFIISLALSVLCNYYIGFFTCIFVLICFIGYTIIHFDGFKPMLKKLGRVALCSAVALMISAMLVLPAYFSLQNTHAVDTVGPEKYGVNLPALQYDFKDTGDTISTTLNGLRHVLGSSMAFTKLTVKEGMPNVSCGMIAIVLALIFFVSKKVSLKEKLFSGGLLVFLGLSFVIRQLDYLWHGMHFTNMLPYRFSYLVSFVIVVMAIRAFDVIHEASNFDVVVAAILTFAIFMICYDLNPDYTIGADKDNNFTTIKVTMYAAIFAAIALAVILLYTSHILKKTYMTLILVALVFVQSGAMALIGVRTTTVTDTMDYPQGTTSTRTLVDAMKEREENTAELWRADFTKPWTYDEPSLYPFNGVTFFSSTANAKAISFMENFGLQGWLSGNRYPYLESTPVTNMFLNMKYLISRDGLYTDKQYLKEIPVENTRGKLLENSLYIPMGFMTDSALLDYKGDYPEDTYNPLKNQNEFFSKATGIKENVFEPVLPTSEPIDSAQQYNTISKPFSESDYGYYKYNFQSVQNPSIKLDYTAPKDGYYFAYARVDNLVNNYVSITPAKNGTTGSYDVKRSYIIPIGYYSQGDTITVSATLSQYTLGSAQIYVSRLNGDVLTEGCNKLRESVMKTTSLKGNSMEGTIDVKEDGVFYTSIPYEEGKTDNDGLIGKLFASKSEGWHAYVDGKEVEITPIGGSMLAFKLGKGKHDIRLHYIPKGFIKGTVMAVVAIAAIILYSLFLLLWRKKKLPKALLAKLPEKEQDEVTYKLPF